MVCNRDGRACTHAGQAVGSPDTEAVQMAGRHQQKCPECGAFLPEGGSCTRCAQLDGQTSGVTATVVERQSIDELSRGIAYDISSNFYAGWEDDSPDLDEWTADIIAEAMRDAQGRQSLTAEEARKLAQAVVSYDIADNLYDPVYKYDRTTKEALIENTVKSVAEGLVQAHNQAQNCPACGGFLTAEGECPKCASTTLPAASGGQAMTMGMAGHPMTDRTADLDRVVKFDGDYWKAEFGSSRGNTITLSNGETLEVGKRFGKKYPNYHASAGKKKALATVGGSLVSAVDVVKEIEDVTVNGRNITRIRTTDGREAHYNHRCRRATCDCGESPCVHQVAATLAGEAAIANDGADLERSEMWGELNALVRAKQQGATSSTADIVRTSDAAYGYLKTAQPEVTYGSTKLHEEVYGRNPTAQNCPNCGAFLKSAGTCSKCGYPNIADGSDGSAESGDGAQGAGTDKGADAKRAAPANGAQKFLQGLQPPMEVDPDEYAEWLQAEVPQPNSGYIQTSVSDRVLGTMKAALGTKWQAMRKKHQQTGEWDSRMGGRVFGLYGPPGTGKNESARELAAYMGVPYVEEDLDAGTDVQRLLGEVVLEDGTTKAKLGRIGHALVNGGVVALNEVVSLDHDMQMRLHRIAQEGVLTVPGPEGGEVSYPIHPNSVLVTTWNPAGGRADRPEQALTSRMINLSVPLPTEAEERKMLVGRLNEEFGMDVKPADVANDVSFMRNMRDLAEQGSLDMEPGFRSTAFFAMMRLTTGDARLAAEQVMVAAAQDSFSLDDVKQEIDMYLGRYFPNA